MAYKVFLDVNIVIDFFLPARPAHPFALQLFDLIEEASQFGYISETVVNTTHYIMRRSVHKEEFRRAMDELVSLTTILPCNNHIIHEAYKKPGVDWEDAVLYQLAVEHQMDYFLTSNIFDLKKLEQHVLPVVTSEQFLKMISS